MGSRRNSQTQNKHQSRTLHHHTHRHRQRLRQRIRLGRIAHTLRPPTPQPTQKQNTIMARRRIILVRSMDSRADHLRRGHHLPNPRQKLTRHTTNTTHTQLLQLLRTRTRRENMLFSRTTKTKEQMAQPSTLRLHRMLQTLQKNHTHQRCSPLLPNTEKSNGITPPLRRRGRNQRGSAG